MTILYEPPASLEAGKAHAKSRKVIPQKPYRRAELGCPVFPFKFDLNSEVSITEELHPREAKIDKCSLLKEGDKIQGDMISGFSLKQIPKPLISKGSASHSASFIDFKKFVYARLEKAFKCIENKKS